MHTNITILATAAVTATKKKNKNKQWVHETKHLIVPLLQTRKTNTFTANALIFDQPIAGTLTVDMRSQ